MNVTHVEAADVFCDEVRAGLLQRTPRGSRFVYEPGFLEACRRRGWGLGFRVPMTPVVETVGVNLHSFFAGLLPEGLRLTALERSVKTSADDLLSLLLAAGTEAVGDVRVVVPGQGVESPPALDLGRLDAVSFAEVLARSLDYRRGGERRLLSGVQPKVSAAMVTLPVRVRKRARAEALLKLQPRELPRLIENEAFFMDLARRCGLDVAESSVVRDRDGVPGLLVTRFDRRASSAPPHRLHCEDGCQLLDRYPADKYRVSFSELADAVRRHVSAPAVELPRLLALLAFSYVIGNGDLHARNVSLLVEATGLVRLAPAYDLLTTLPYGDRRLALKVLGRDDNLKRAHFVELARLLELPERPVLNALDRVCDATGEAVGALGDLGFDRRKTADLARVMAKRRAELGGARRASR